MSVYVDTCVHAYAIVWGYVHTGKFVHMAICIYVFCLLCYAYMCTCIIACTYAFRCACICVLVACMCTFVFEYMDIRDTFICANT